MKTDELQKKRQQTKPVSIRSKTEERVIFILIPPREDSTLAPPFNVPQFMVFHNVAFNFNDSKPIIPVTNYFHLINCSV